MTIKSYMKNNILLLKLVGLWTDEDHFSKSHWIYCLAVNVGFVGLFNLCQAIYYIINITNVQVIATYGYVFLLFAMSNVKSYFYLTNWKLIKSLFRQLDHAEFQPKSDSQRRNTASLLNINRAIFWMYEIQGLMAVPLWHLNPILFAKTRELPFHAWYPYDITNNFNFILTYVHQSIAMVLIIQINIGLDLVAFGLTACIGAECDILSDTLENLHTFTSVIANNKETSETSDGDVADPGFLVEMEKALHWCFGFHRKILKFANGTNKFLSTLMFMQFSTSLFSICFCLLALTDVQDYNSEHMVIAVLLIVNFAELVFYCWFGNEAMWRSSNISNAVYKSSWVDCSDSYRKKILFFMVRTQKPIKMYALNFFVISLPTCIAILRASYSFFAMLYQVRRQDK